MRLDQTTIEQVSEAKRRNPPWLGKGWIITHHPQFSGEARDGQRREALAGDSVRLMTDANADAVSYSLWRRPPASRAEITKAGELTFDVTGLYVAALTADGWHRIIEFAVWPADMLTRMVANPRGHTGTPPRLVLRSLLNDSACTRDTIIAALESNAAHPLQHIHGDRAVNLQNYGI